MSSLTHGTVKRLVVEKGFGFIADHDNVEYFFHRSSVMHPGYDSLEEGQQVEFQKGESAKGPRAENVVGL